MSSSATRRVLGPIVRSAFRLRGTLWRARKRMFRELWRRRHGSRAATYATSLEHVRTRDQIPELLNRRELVGTGVEIGVQRGKYSEFLLAHWRGRKLVSVDPWREAPPDEYVDRSNVEQAEQDRFYAETSARLARFGERSEIKRMTSVEAASTVEAATLDFVYIDARHDYASVREDLETWYSKLRPGGVIAGHDYVDGTLPSGVYGVRRAVDEFFAPLHLEVHATDGGPRSVELQPSWIVAVPA